MNTQRRIDVYTRNRTTLTPHQRRRVVHKARGKERAAALAMIAALITVGATSCGRGAGSREARGRLVGTSASPAHNHWNGYRGPTTTTARVHTQAPPPVSRSRPPVVSRGSGATGGGVWDCIAEKESGNGRGSANIYQFLPSTWRSAARENNSPYATPESAPPAEQRRVAEAWGAKHGIRNQWTTGARCGA